MSIDDATLVHPAFAERFNAGDLDGILSLAEEDAVFVPQPGVHLIGADAAAAQQQFMALGLPINMAVRQAIVTGNVALVIADWTIKGTGPDGKAVDLAGSTADVLRKGNDGWKFVIDNPFGTA